MIYTELTKKALKIAYNAHHGQIDREGLPYIHHPIHLAEQMEDEDSCVVALLHDVIEDTDVTLDDLAAEGFTVSQLEAIRLMTHIPLADNATEEERLDDYFQYVEQIKDNDIARRVKLADLAHNSDETRLGRPGEDDHKRREKYKKAVRILTE